MDSKKILTDMGLKKLLFHLSYVKFSYVFFFCVIALPIRFSKNKVEIFPSAKIDLLATISFILIFSLCFFLIKYLLTKNFKNFLSNLRLLSLENVFFKITLLIFFLFFVYLVTASIYYPLYFFNIAFLYLTTKSGESRSNQNQVKLISLIIISFSIASYIIVSKTPDPIFITSLVTSSPFYLVAMLFQNEKSIYFIYRILFSIIFFFSTSIMSPFLLLFGLISVWVTKIYFFLNKDTQYPSLYKIYDDRD